MLEPWHAEAYWESFLPGGVVAALGAYPLGRLGAWFPSAGGLVEYLFRGFGGGFYAGSCAVLLCSCKLLALTLSGGASGSYGSAELAGFVLLALSLVVFRRRGGRNGISSRGDGDAAQQNYRNSPITGSRDHV